MNPTVQTGPEVIPLWPGGAPGSESWTQQEQESLLPPGLKVVRNVTQPSLTAYLPDPAVANGLAVIVCPGGAFHFLSIDMEGTDVARWLVARGVAAFVLKYRLLPTGANFPQEVWDKLGERERLAALLEPLRPLLLADGQQALRLVRQRAADWGLAPDRVGLLGFSAGGAVTAAAALQSVAGRGPDFAAVIYGALDREAVVPPQAPPLFLLCAADDEMAVSGSLPLFVVWRAAGRPVELHIYTKGGHGFGMTEQTLPSDSWIERFYDWLLALEWPGQSTE